MLIEAKKSTQNQARNTAKSANIAPGRRPAGELTGDKLTFNHVMVYAKDVQRALDFCRDLLGFKLVDEFHHEGKPVYARLRAPGGDGTIALHLPGPGTSLPSEGVRLYFEIREIDDLCCKLQAKGFDITQMPRMMPWGWRRAYLNDPDGHEISIYWAGEKRCDHSALVARQPTNRSSQASREGFKVTRGSAHDKAWSNRHGRH